MTSKRNLGPILAIAGGAIAIAAVITGFILIGGPGDARDRRLDEMTMGRVTDVLNIAQCAFNEIGSAPASIDDARKVQRKPDDRNDAPTCAYNSAPKDIPVSAGTNPPNPGDVSYAAVSTQHIKICAKFRRPTDQKTCNGICYGGPHGAAYPQFMEARPAGVHCYDVELAKGVDLSAVWPSHDGHFTVIE